MDYAQLGQKVKAKYPQYQNVPDEELGRKVVEKYPVYKNQISDVPSKSLGQKVLGSSLIPAAGGLAGGLVGGLLGPVTGVAGAAAGAGAAESGRQALQSLLNQEAPSAGKVGKEAATSGLGELVGLGAAKVAAPVVKAAAAPFERVGDLLVRTGTKPGTKVAGEALDQGLNIFDILSEKGLLGGNRTEVLNKIPKLIKPYEDTIQNAVSQSGKNTILTKKELQGVIDELKGRVLNEDAAQAVLDKFTSKFGSKYTAEDALKLKRMFQNLAIKGESDTAATQRQALNEIVSFLRNRLKDAVPATRDALREEQKLILAKEAIKKARVSEDIQGLQTTNWLNTLGRGASKALGVNSSQVGSAIKNVTQSVTSPKSNNFIDAMLRLSGQTGVRIPSLFSSQ